MASDLDEVQPIDSGGDQTDDRLPELREILLRGDEAYLSETVESVLDTALTRKIDESRDQMAEVLSPVIGQAIRHQIHVAQEDIIDALYPVIGGAIQRAVTEAMQALAERVDRGLRSTFSAKRLTRRIRARLRGIPESELLLRDALPFQAQEVFLIDRSSGLLLEHVSRTPGEDADRDLGPVVPTYYRGASGAIIACDLTRPETLVGSSAYAEGFLKANPKAKIVMAANKVDLVDERRLSDEELATNAAAHDAYLFLTSAKTGERVEDMFHHLGTMLASG